MSDNAANTYLKLPPAGKGPGILVLHAWWGLNEFFKGVCARLAQEGYVVAAPDLYHGKTADTVAGAEKLRSTLRQRQVKAEIVAALQDLHAQPAIAGRSLGVVGFSLGAYWALWLAIEKPEWIKAVTVFYGTRGGDYSKSQAAFSGHFAETDEYEPASAVKRFEQDLRKANRPATFYTYEGTGHWFFEKDRKTAYNPKAAELAWERTLEFTRAQLGK